MNARNDRFRNLMQSTAEHERAERYAHETMAYAENERLDFENEPKFWFEFNYNDGHRVSTHRIRQSLVDKINAYSEKRNIDLVITRSPDHFQ